MRYHTKKISYKDWFWVLAYVVFMLAIPWEDLQGKSFVDKERYIDYFNYQVNVLDYKDFSKLYSYITNEALWHFSIPWLMQNFGWDVEHIILGITVFALVVYSVFYVKHKPGWSIIFMVNPLVVNLVFSQVRSVLAFSLLMSAYLINRKWISGLFVLPALFIHTSSLIFLSVYFAIKISTKLDKSKLFANNIPYFFSVGLGVAVSIAIGPFRSKLLGAVGDRRAEYGDASSSVTYTLFWVGLLVLCYFQRRAFYNTELVRFGIFILALATANLLTGGYTTRFLALAFPMLLITMHEIDKDKKSICFGVFIVYVFLLWIYWLSVKLI